MVLAVDIGNTNVVIGCFDKDEIRFVERLSTNKNSTSLEYLVLIKTVLELYGLENHRLDGSIISSVVPSVTARVKEAVEKLTGRAPLVVGPGLKTGLKIKLDNPLQLGSDRVADAVAATNLYPCPLIIVDMGTATTVSVVDGDKNFIGGMIMPGLMVSMEALATRTSQLPHIGLEAPKRAIGRNTADCIRSGLIYGNASAVDGLITSIEKELGEKCTVISTGGLARIVTPLCSHEIIEDDKLLLKGLMIIYGKNS